MQLTGGQAERVSQPLGARGGERSTVSVRADFNVRFLRRAGWKNLTFSQFAAFALQKTEPRFASLPVPCSTSVVCFITIADFAL